MHKKTLILKVPTSRYKLLVKMNRNVWNTKQGKKAIRNHNQMTFEAKQRGIAIGEQRGRDQGEYDKSIYIP